MPPFENLLVFVISGLVVNVTPGPDVLYIVGRSLSQGRAAGVVSALGIAVGCLAHVGAAAFGVTAILLAWPLVYDLVRFAGAAYLVSLGILTLRHGRHRLLVPSAVRAPLQRVFWQGALTNLLNPKVALFFAAFLPQFADASQGALPLQLLTLGLIFVANGLMVCLAYAVAASVVHDRVLCRTDALAWLTRITGGLFIALGVRLALVDRH